MPIATLAPEPRGAPPRLTGHYKTRAEARVGYGEIVRELEACDDQATLDCYLISIKPILDQFQTEMPFFWDGDGFGFLGLSLEIDAAHLRVVTTAVRDDPEW